MYKLTKDNQSVIRKAYGACIPFAPGNRDYQTYLEWKSEGGIPDPAQSLDELKVEKEQEMQEEKRKAKLKGIIVDGVLFDTDDSARLAYIELFLKFITNPSYTVSDWKASEGNWVTMDYLTFTKLMSAWEVRLSGLFSFIKIKEQEIKTKNSPEDIKGVVVRYDED